MSSEVAIRVRSLSKAYQIYDKPRHRLLQMLFRGRKQYFREFHALEDVSFEILRGETVGIIGRNGSGKSTLLQLLCGTLSPTNGSIEITGKVAALLELGAGFNPEFTGRENIYLSASLYGLSIDQINARLGQILAFAEIGDFIDQPVKNYSSGMFVRLAFAVIAHVDADILVVDEALAVGDAYFVQKCMRFLREFTVRGTLLFVSHDTSAVIALCSQALLMKNGKLEKIGTPKNVAEYYLSSLHKSLPTSSTATTVSQAQELNDTNDLSAPPQGENDFGSGTAKILSVTLTLENGDPLPSLYGGETVNLKVKGRAFSDVASPIVGFFVKDRLGQAIFGYHSYDESITKTAAQRGQIIEANFCFMLPKLARGNYSITTSIANGTPENHEQLHWIHDAIIIEMAEEEYRYGIFELEYMRASLHCE